MAAVRQGSSLFRPPLPPLQAGVRVVIRPSAVSSRIYPNATPKSRGTALRPWKHGAGTNARLMVAEAETEGQPDTMADGLNWEMVVLVSVRRWCAHGTNIAHFNK